VSEAELRLGLTLADVGESKFDVADLLRCGLTSSDLYLDLVDVDPHDGTGWTDKAGEIE